jgi:putative membrane protein
MMTGYGMGFGGFILMILFWVVIIGGSIALLAAIFPKIGTSLKNRSGSEDDPLMILKQRYARGELSKEEFETIRHDLEQT